MINPTTFLGGVLLGLASSVHCAGMCGGVGAALLAGFAGDRDLPSQGRVLVSVQGAKAAAYALAGAAVGALGSGVYHLFDRQDAYRALQWLAAASLFWIGLSLMGLVPVGMGFDRLTAPLRNWAWSRRRPGWGAFGLAGLAWGLLPCSMVYSALAFAMLAGSALGGAAVMLGFGLGTMPAVTAAALGATRLPRLARTQGARFGVGAGLLLIAAATLFWPVAGPLSRCLG